MQVVIKVDRRQITVRAGSAGPGKSGSVILSLFLQYERLKTCRERIQCVKKEEWMRFTMGGVRTQFAHVCTSGLSAILSADTVSEV